MIEESKYCIDIVKEISKEIVMTKKLMKILKTPQNVIMFKLMVMLKQEIIVISLQYKEALRIEIIISRLN